MNMDITPNTEKVPTENIENFNSLKRFRSMNSNIIISPPKKLAKIISNISPVQLSPEFLMNDSQNNSKSASIRERLPSYQSPLGTKSLSNESDIDKSLNIPLFQEHISLRSESIYNSVTRILLTYFVATPVINRTIRLTVASDELEKSESNEGYEEIIQEEIENKTGVPNKFFFLFLALHALSLKTENVLNKGTPNRNLVSCSGSPE